MGRKKIQEKDPAAVELMLKTYLHTANEKIAAKAGGFTTRTARKYLHAEGIYPRPGRKQGRFYPGVYRSKFHRWMQENPSIDLKGKSLDELSRLSGCSKKIIRDYLYRLRKAILREIESLPDLRSMQGSLYTTDGLRIPFDLWKSYRIYKLGYSRKVLIVALMPTGVEKRFIVHLDALWAQIPQSSKSEKPTIERKAL